MLSYSSRIYRTRAGTIHCFYHQTSSFDNFNKIKALYNEGKQAYAIHEYFKNPHLFAESFLIARQNTIDMALKIYQAVENNSTLDFLVIMSLISVLEKSNKYHMIIDTVLDDLMIQMQNMKGKDISKIKTTD